MTKETSKKTATVNKAAEAAKQTAAPVKAEPVKKAEAKKAEPVKAAVPAKAEPVKKAVEKTAAKAEPVKKAESVKKTEPVKKQAAAKTEPAKKPAAVKAEPAKKEAAKKTAAGPAKKQTAAKKTEVKTNFVIQSQGREISEKEIVALGKKAWTAAGNKVRDIKTLTAYVQPENGKVYFVINGVALEGDGSDF